ncbi:MAG: helix-turn-helix domain-containing protein [Fimbriimonadales bacterium]
MRERGVSKSELARRLGFHVTQVQRLLDLRHVSRLDRIEAAVAILGKRLSIEIKSAA